MPTVRSRIWIPSLLLGWTLACGFGLDEVEVADTDQFAPDPTSNRDDPPGPGGHLPSDLRGIWVAEIRPADQRRLEVLEAGRDPDALGRLDPPIGAGEQGWFTEVNDPLSKNYHWWFCATRCRVEIRDSGIWLEGFLIYDRLGSGLMTTRIEGRDVYYDLVGHDPDGRTGVVHIRMNREWTSFRIIHLEIDGFVLPYLDELLVFPYYRRTPELR